MYLVSQNVNLKSHKYVYMITYRYRSGVGTSKFILSFGSKFSINNTRVKVISLNKELTNLMRTTKCIIF